MSPGWPFAFMLPFWMIAVVLASLTVQCERCGKNPIYPHHDRYPRFAFANPFFGRVCTFCNEPLDLEAAPIAKSAHDGEAPAPKSPFPYR